MPASGLLPGLSRDDSGEPEFPFWDSDSSVANALETSRPSRVLVQPKLRHTETSRPSRVFARVFRQGGGEVGGRGNWGAESGGRFVESPQRLFHFAHILPRPVSLEGAESTDQDVSFHPVAFILIGEQVQVVLLEVVIGEVILHGHSRSVEYSKRIGCANTI